MSFLFIQILNIFRYYGKTIEIKHLLYHTSGIRD